MKHKSHTNEKYKQYQKTKAHKRYSKYKTAIKDQLFFDALTNLNKGV